MAINRFQLPLIYQCVEEAIGANNAQGVWQIEAVWGTGAPGARLYFVVVNQLLAGSNPFVPVQITVDSQHRTTTTVVTGSAAATPHAALANCVTLFNAMSGAVETAPQAVGV